MGLYGRLTEGARVGLTHRLKPGDTIKVGDDICIRVLPGSYGTNIRVNVEAPRDTSITVEKVQKTQHIDDACP